MDTTPSDAHRLHAFSWLFVFFTQLRQVVLPLLAFGLFGRGAWWELFIPLGAAGLAVYALIYSFGFRYWLGADEFLVREGIFKRTERHIPYARIQNIVMRRNLLHRAFGVTELRLESAGGTRPEAVMNVITLAEARRIERVLRDRGSSAAADPAADEAGSVLLALGPRDLFRLGLITNRGWVAVGAVFALFWQFEPWERGGFRRAFRAVGETVGAWEGLLSGLVTGASTLLLGVAAFLVTIKLLSIVMAFLSFHGFRLERHGERIGTEHGLLTRQAASARRDKIQRLLIAESWLARRLGLRRLSCEVAAGPDAVNDNDGARLRWLAPVAPPGDVQRIALEVAPGLDAEAMAWRPLHPRAWWRMFKVSARIWSLVAIPAIVNFGPWVGAAAWLVMMVLSWFSARGEARFGAWACDGAVVAYRSGWINRTWMLARVAKGQVVALKRSPFDRRAGMAAVALDTAGASALGNEMTVHYLAEADARELFELLRRGIDPPERALDRIQQPG